MGSFPGGIFHSWRFRHVALLAVAAAALLLVGRVSDAHPPGLSPWPSPWTPYSVSLEDDQGNVLRTFHRDGTTFVLGYEGERYNVRLTNHGDRRVEAVLTVDGRDVVSGTPGDYVR